MQAPGRGSVKGAVLEPPSRSITRPQAMVFAGIGKNHRARCKMIHFATSPFLTQTRFSPDAAEMSRTQNRISQAENKNYKDIAQNFPD